MAASIEMDSSIRVGMGVYGTRSSRLYRTGPPLGFWGCFLGDAPGSTDGGGFEHQEISINATLRHSAGTCHFRHLGLWYQYIRRS